METVWQYCTALFSTLPTWAVWMLGVPAGLLALALAVVLGGILLGITWGICTGGDARRVFPMNDSRAAVPVTPRLSRSSWYGRLLLTAYGKDRGWIVFLRRATFTTRFNAPPLPAELAGVPQEKLRRLAAWSDYQWRCAEAKARALAFLWLPPYIQPFFPDAPRGNLCPTFWKVMFASYIYVLGVALPRGIGAAVVHTWHLIMDPIVAAFRFVFRRFGRVIGYACVTALYVSMLYGMWHLGNYVAREEMTGPVMTPALKASLARRLAEDREKMEQEIARACERMIGENKDEDYCCRRSEETNEETFLRCAKIRFPYRAALRSLEDGDLVCWPPGAFGRIDDLFPLKGQDALARRMAHKLRLVFADKLAEENVEHRKGLVQARLRDAEALINARSELEQYADARSVYGRFTFWCREENGGWNATNNSPSYVVSGTCAALAGMFEDKLDAAHSELNAEKWRARWTNLREFAVAMGPWAVAGILGVIAGGALLAMALILVRLGLRALWRAAWFVRLRREIRVLLEPVIRVWRETWAFVRGYLSAWWRRRCPLVDWVD